MDLKLHFMARTLDEPVRPSLSTTHASSMPICQGNSRLLEQACLIPAGGRCPVLSYMRYDSSSQMQSWLHPVEAPRIHF